MAVHATPRIRTRSARRTLVSLLLIPLVSLAGLWGFTASITLGNVIRDQHYNTINRTIAPSVIGLEQTLEAERGITFAWLTAARRTPQLRAQLLTARRGTDAADAALSASTASVRGLLTPTAQGLLDKLRTALSGLAGIRAAVDSGADGPVTSFAAYDAIDSYLWGFLQVATSPSDAELSQMTQAGLAVGQAEDFTGAAISLIQGALGARGQMNQPERTLLAQLAAEQDLEIGDTFALATPAQSALFTQIFDTPSYRQLTAAEAAIASGSANRPVPVAPAAFQATARVIEAKIASSEPPTGEVLAAESQRLSHDLQTELYLAAGLGLLAVVASVFVALRFGRRLRVELTGLFDSARQMADERLPQLVARLRGGEDVDVLAESPPLRSGRISEIANVARAFSSVQRTAVEAAVGQARLRKGVNQVFVSLSLRSQSLLHRQLTMLDEMERATSDPVALADLFRLDHLTTRMRRHAEGLLILAGSTPGRGWRDPVPAADVLNAAVAEIEDYVRVDVVTEATDAVAGTAVNDVIHLLAELAENATTFSPPNTRVEVRGDSVGNGFVVEIEDRGLGMPADEIAALNEQLARPPEFDLANSDQLGLFVAAGLAQRHEIRISLRQSPFGGTTAIVLLPPAIMVSASGADWQPAFGLTGRHRRPGAAPELGSVPAPRIAPPVRTQFVVGQPVLDPFAPDPPAPEQTKPRAGGWFSRVQAPRDIHAGGARGTGMAGGARGTGASRPVLPRRVRQESMAPQLRATFSSAAASDGPERHRPQAWPGGPATDEPSARSPEEAGSTLSALQAGWERARLQTDDEDQ